MNLICSMFIWFQVLLHLLCFVKYEHISLSYVKSKIWIDLLLRYRKHSLCNLVGSNAVYNNCLKNYQTQCQMTTPARFTDLRSIENLKMWEMSKKELLNVGLQFLNRC